MTKKVISDNSKKLSIRDKEIEIKLRMLFKIEYDPKIDRGEYHGPKEIEFMSRIEKILEGDFNNFEDFVKILTFHIVDEKCFEQMETK